MLMICYLTPHTKSSRLVRMCRQYQKPHWTAPPPIWWQNTVRLGAKGPSGAPPKGQESKLSISHTSNHLWGCKSNHPLQVLLLHSSAPHQSGQICTWQNTKFHQPLQNCQSRLIFDRHTQWSSEKYLYSPCESDDKENVEANISAEEPNYRNVCIAELRYKQPIIHQK